MVKHASNVTQCALAIERFALGAAAEAHTRLESRATVGALILTP